MIMVQAIRLDVHGHFQYRIDAPGREVVVTDEEKAIALLRELGVANPAVLIEHVRLWGSIELPDPETRSPDHWGSVV
jgi:hypothetical protein